MTTSFGDLGITTPTLVVDLAVMRDNIARMAAYAASAGVALRPHVKTHKVLEIAAVQRDAGARGITVATVAEAEAFVAAGHDDVFIAYPVWLDDARGRRLAALTDRARVRMGCDSAEAARRAAAALRGAPVEVLVEVDSGMGRSGAAPERAGEVGAAARDAGLDVVGVFTFPGHSYHPDARRAAADQEAVGLARAAESLLAQGIEPLVISGGSSPSAAYAGGTLTELRPGAYVFNDAQQWELGACTREQIALTAYATVVSHAGGRIVLDAGSKALGADRPGWASGFGRLVDLPDARIVGLSEHHAVVELAESLPPLGSVVRVAPNHCCNAVNLADELVAVDGGERVATWRVAARNANT
ncbi:alanine racemase [Mariniluteicoccus flavus]